MKHFNIIFLFFLFGSLVFCSAQNKKKVTFGGNVSLDFGKLNNRIEVNPTFSFKIFTKIYLGLGLNYFYNKQLASSYSFNETTNVEKELKLKEKSNYYGASTFFRYYAFEKKKYVIKNLYLHTEFEHLIGRIKYTYLNGTYKYKNNSNNILSGIGFKYFLGKKFAINSNLLFKLNNSNNSPYRNPVFRLGLEF